MTNEIVLAGDGTAEEMETHLIKDLKQRDWLVSGVIELIERELEPPEGSKGPYRVRIKRPPVAKPQKMRWEWH